MVLESCNILLSVGTSIVGTILTLLFVLGSYKQKVDGSVKSIEKIEIKVAELSDRISKLEGGIERDRAYSGLAKSKSPLALTEKGKVLLLDSQGNNYIELNKNDLIAEIKKSNPKSAYYVQELSKHVIKNRSDTDSFIPLKDFAYRKGIDLDDVIFDEYFTKRYCSERTWV